MMKWVWFIALILFLPFAAKAYDATIYGSLQCIFGSCTAEVRQTSLSTCQSQFLGLYKNLMAEHKDIYYQVPCFEEMAVKSFPGKPDQEFYTGYFVGRLLYYR